MVVYILSKCIFLMPAKMGELRLWMLQPTQISLWTCGNRCSNHRFGSSILWEGSVGMRVTCSLQPKVLRCYWYFVYSKEDFIANWIKLTGSLRMCSKLRSLLADAGHVGCGLEWMFSLRWKLGLGRSWWWTKSESSGGPYLTKMDSMVQCAIRTEAMIEVEYMYYIEIFAGNIVVRWSSGYGLWQLLHLFYHQHGCIRVVPISLSQSWGHEGTKADITVWKQQL